MVPLDNTITWQLFLYFCNELHFLRIPQTNINIAAALYVPFRCVIRQAY